jgi:hypothetical protein
MHATMHTRGAGGRPHKVSSEFMLKISEGTAPVRALEPRFKTFRLRSCAS